MFRFGLVFMWQSDGIWHFYMAIGPGWADSWTVMRLDTGAVTTAREYNLTNIMAR